MQVAAVCWLQLISHKDEETQKKMFNPREVFQCTTHSTCSTKIRLEYKTTSLSVSSLAHSNTNSSEKIGRKIDWRPQIEIILTCVLAPRRRWKVSWRCASPWRFRSVAELPPEVRKRPTNNERVWICIKKPFKFPLVGCRSSVFCSTFFMFRN